jgi:hypothetical protein
MAPQFPEEDTEEAREGEAAHELGAAMIQAADGRKHPLAIDGPASNGTILTEEIWATSETYANNVIETLEGEPADCIAIEQTIRTPIHENCWGTPDAALWIPRLHTLLIWDFKYGHGVVEAFENSQLICYASGCLAQLGWPSEATVKLRVVQPRAYHPEGPIRTWAPKSEALQHHITLLRGAASACLDCEGGADTHSGAHCRYCSARHACPAALAAGIRLYEATKRPTPVNMTPAELGAQLAIVQRARKHLECLETALAQQATAALKGGQLVPGYMLAPGPGRLEWSKPPAQILRLGALLGVDLLKPAAPITPTQARKTGLNPELINAHTHTTATGLKLQADSGTLARKTFQ